MFFFYSLFQLHIFCIGTQPVVAGIPVPPSPVNIPRLAQHLHYHPNRSFVDYLINGFCDGFDIGYSGPITQGVDKNLKSARDNVQLVTSAVEKEVSRGHTLGPFNTPPFSVSHISPLGAVPKKDGSKRLILDLSSPSGSSINDGISHDEFSVKYSHFDDAINMIREIGGTPYMAKIDIKHAFRLCPVRPSDFPLLCFKWLGLYYVDCRLSMGSRSSPYIFNTFADALCWIIINVLLIKNIIHYLDDFFLAAPTKELCRKFRDSILSLFATLGVPVAEDKLEGPDTSLPYLGINVDSENKIISLPQDKVDKLRPILKRFSTLKKCTKRELLSLIGRLSFAAKVVKPGRLFLRHLIDLSTKTKRLEHYVYLNKDVRLDLEWWSQALDKHNGVSIIQENFVTSTELQLFTDASGIIGFGGVFGTHWFYAAWPDKFRNLCSIDINFKELFAIIVAFELWGSHFLNKQILFHSDSQVICDLWKKRSAKDSALLRLLRHLFFRSLDFNCNILITHIPGKVNRLADCLSRLQIEEFRHLASDMDPLPTPIPEFVWDI